jgi:hypothetical protein
MRVALFALFSVAGCFAPQVQSGQLLCSTNGTCPAGFTCVADHCWANGYGPDLSVTTLEDMSGPDDSDGAGVSADMSSPPLVTNTHALETDTIAINTLVSVANVIVIGPTFAVARPAMLKCNYTAYVEDPTQPAPNGLQIFGAVTNCQPNTDGGGCTCPALSNTAIDALDTLGDRFTLVGRYITFGTAPVTHELSPLSSATRTGSGTVTAVTLTDIGGFAPGGTGFTAYENMLVSLQPTGGISIGAPDAQGSFSGSGIAFSGVYQAAYYNGGTFPVGGTNFVNIEGVANPTLSNIMPRLRSDFAP